MLKRKVAFVHSVKLVIKLEVIDVEDAERKGTVSVGLKFSVHNFEEELVVDKTGKFVSSGIFNGFFVNGGVFNRFGADCRNGFKESDGGGVGKGFFRLSGKHYDTGKACVAGNRNVTFSLVAEKKSFFAFPKASVNKLAGKILVKKTFLRAFKAGNKRMVRLEIKVLFFKGVKGVLNAVSSVCTADEDKHAAESNVVADGFRHCLKNIAYVEHVCDIFGKACKGSFLSLFFLRENSGEGSAYHEIENGNDHYQYCASEDERSGIINTEFADKKIADGAKGFKENSGSQSGGHKDIVRG